jgi:riboflavin biosynthesis pyrimidine reductase
VDEIILKVNPVLFGSGIPLFLGTIKQTDMELIHTRQYGNGVVLLQYRVKN